MLFSEVSKVFNNIEQVSGRLEITKLLSNLFIKANNQEAKIIAYLSLGVLHPAYIGTKFNLAEKNIVNIIAKLLNKDSQEILDLLKKSGDLGSLVINNNFNNNKNHSLDLTSIYNNLCELEKISGTGSVDSKSEYLYNILLNCDDLSAKYIIRIILGKLRLGFSDMTIIDSLSWMLAGDKSLRTKIEHAYNLSANIGEVAFVTKDQGIAGIEKAKITLGVPIRPAAAERLNNSKEIIEKLGLCAAQPKLDGFRLQIHLDNKNNIIKFFSRNLLDMSNMFPDLINSFKNLEIKKNIKINNLICEGEAIVYDQDTNTYLPFQETVKRRRKHNIDQVSSEMPLKIILFDILYLNDQELLSKTHKERRKILLSLSNKEVDLVNLDLKLNNSNNSLDQQIDLFNKLKSGLDDNISEKVLLEKQDNRIQIIQELITDDYKELEEYFLENVSDGLEGLVIKKISAQYQPGKRNFNWIKLKRKEAGHIDDTIDAVILGYYYGSGKRAKFGIGAFLVGIYNKSLDIFETVAKVGTGLKDSDWRELYSKCQKIKISSKPNNVSCDKNLFPDVWVEPELVCLILADEITKSPIHTAKYALRFPRFKGYREDKSIFDITTSVELKELFDLQFK